MSLALEEKEFYKILPAYKLQQSASHVIKFGFRSDAPDLLYGAKSCISSQTAYRTLHTCIP